MFLIFHNEKNNQITVKQTDFPINESAMQSYFAMRFVLFVVSRPPTVKPKNTKWRWRFWRKAVDWRLTRAAVFESPDDFLSVLRQLSNRLVKDPRHGFWRKRNSGFGNSPLPCHQNGRRQVFVHRLVNIRIAVLAKKGKKATEGVFLGHNFGQSADKGGMLRSDVVGFAGRGPTSGCKIRRALGDF